MYELADAERYQNVIPLMPDARRPVTILIVEDDRLQRSLLTKSVEALGHQVVEAENGVQAIETLQANPMAVDAVLMDRIMPLMDGVSAVRRIKEMRELRAIPIVMVTGAASPHEMQEGMEAGVFYYLDKPVDDRVLESILQAALRESEQNRLLSRNMKRQRTSFNLMQSCKFEFATLEQAECLAAFMAHGFPEPERTLTGLAELLINAIEHGNLEIGYEAKTRLLEERSWRAEIERRQAMPQFSHRKGEAVLARRDGGVYAIITDQGKGFDWRAYMNINPARAGDNHGRGIAQANALSFDRLTYNEQGNQAVAFVGNDPPLQW